MRRGARPQRPGPRERRFGLWARASGRLAAPAAGVERADSWATDAHKWLNVPYDSGLAVVRDAGMLRGAMSVQADYLPDRASRDPFEFTPETSRRMRGLEVWAAVASLGRDGFEELVDRNCRQARRFAAGLHDADCEFLNDVVLNQILLAFGDDRVTTEIIRGVSARAPAGAGGRTGTAGPRCASASPHGRPATTMWSEASPRSSASRAKSGIGSRRTVTAAGMIEGTMAGCDDAARHPARTSYGAANRRYADTGLEAEARTRLCGPYVIRFRRVPPRTRPRCDARG